MNKSDFIEISNKHDDFVFMFRYFKQVPPEELASRSYKFPFDTIDLKVIGFLVIDDKIVLHMISESEHCDVEFESDDIYNKINHTNSVDYIGVFYDGHFKDLAICDIAHSDMTIIFEVID